MKGTLIDKIPNKVPQNIQHLTAGADTYDSSSFLETHVYLIDKDDGYYLRCAKTDTLEKEAKTAQYFHFKKLDAEILNYTSNDHGWLLTKAVVGHNCIDSEYLGHLRRLCDMITTELRKLHEINYSDCPVVDRTAEYLAKAENNYRTENYDKSSLPSSPGYRSVKQTYEALTAGKDVLQSQILLYGGYCLPNIVLDNWKFSESIDLNCVGVGNRHIDLLWGTWTPWFNLKTNQYRDRFLNVYGGDRADEELLKVVVAAEISG